MSEGLEALKDIREIFTCHDFDFIEKCDIIEKELKALEIIKEKKVNVSLLFNTKNHWDYNDYICRAQIYLQSNSKCITQEEYNLLKEVLEK